MVAWRRSNLGAALRLANQPRQSWDRLKFQHETGEGIMSYAIAECDQIGQALAHAIARKKFKCPLQPLLCSTHLQRRAKCTINLNNWS